MVAGKWCSFGGGLVVIWWFSTKSTEWTEFPDGVGGAGTWWCFDGDGGVLVWFFAGVRKAAVNHRGGSWNTESRIPKTEGIPKIEFRMSCSHTWQMPLEGLGNLDMKMGDMKMLSLTPPPHCTACHPWPWRRRMGYWTEERERHVEVCHTAEIFPNHWDAVQEGPGGRNPFCECLCQHEREDRPWRGTWYRPWNGFPKRETMGQARRKAWLDVSFAHCRAYRKAQSQRLKIDQAIHLT
jgi:hypothetical protein